MSARSRASIAALAVTAAATCFTSLAPSAAVASSGASCPLPTFGPGYYYTQVRQAEAWRIARAEAVEEQHTRAFRLALDLGLKMAMGCDCGAPSRMPNGER